MDKSQSTCGQAGEHLWTDNSSCGRCPTPVEEITAVHGLAPDHSTGRSARTRLSVYPFLNHPHYPQAPYPPPVLPPPIPQKERYPLPAPRHYHYHYHSGPQIGPERARRSKSHKEGPGRMAHAPPSSSSRNSRSALISNPNRRSARLLVVHFGWAHPLASKLFRSTTLALEVRRCACRDCARDTRPEFSGALCRTR